ncbi:hypothetical protein [Paraburkholderia tropica]|uniref:hypothetical protein n=1 Tax=Paraburkholderia tropica TaxID=92647 RepID=UPI002AB63882|nr:hypothetical protein [Paraburkholderia tropica]
MLTETELREHYASLQQRALRVWSQSQLRVDWLAAAGQTPPGQHAEDYLGVVAAATDAAMMAASSYHRSLPFLETANSLMESLAKPSASADDEEWRDQLLFRLAEVLETAADLIAEGETNLVQSERVDI